jgi:hypothetical protein
MEPGARVGIVATAIHGRCELIGWGTYLGRITFRDRSVPKIQLDSGEEMLGFEFWWGPEEDVKRQLQHYTEIVTVTLQEARTRMALVDEALSKTQGKYV